MMREARFFLAGLAVIAVFIVALLQIATWLHP